jgi:hypothetical protein
VPADFSDRRAGARRRGRARRTLGATTHLAHIISVPALGVPELGLALTSARRDPGDATETHADLIVIGTHGRRGLSRMLLGRVAEAIVRTASCPVLTCAAL